MYKTPLLVILILPLLSLWLFPSATPALGTVSLLFTLVLSTYTIFEKHKETENARAKILKEVGVMVLTLVVIIFLSGFAAMWTNFYISLSFRAVVGLIGAVGISFAVGYFILKGMGKLAT